MDLYVSQEVLDEVRDVLTRPKLQRKFPSLTAEHVEAFLGRIGRSSTLVGRVPPVLTLLRDPKDDKYLNLVVASGASYLVSRDNDLLDLMDDKRPDGKTFRATYPDVTILDPVEFLRGLERPASMEEPKSAP
jgi:putative PIN family toxin of toxin-antitoxin system